MQLHFLSSLRVARIENCCMGELEVILKPWLWPLHPALSRVNTLETALLETTLVTVPCIKT